MSDSRLLACPVPKSAAIQAEPFEQRAGQVGRLHQRLAAGQFSEVVGEAHQPHELRRFVVQGFVARSDAAMFAERKAARREQRQLRVGGQALWSNCSQNAPRHRSKRRHLAGVGVLDAQHFVGIELVGEPIVGHRDKRRRLGIFFVGEMLAHRKRRVPRTAHGARVDPQAKRLRPDESHWLAAAKRRASASPRRRRPV